jgi:hypothetical protein
MDMWGITEKQMAVVCDDVPALGAVIEWGMGGSTGRLLAMCEERESQLYSFENNAEWFQKVTKALLPATRWTPLLYKRKMVSCGNSVEIVRDYPRIKHEFGISSQIFHSQQESAVLMTDYVQARLEQGDLDSTLIPLAQLFFVDGYARGPCISCIHALAPAGSVVYLHDAGRKDWYQWATSLPRFHNHKLVLAAVLPELPSLLRFEVE